MSASATQGGHNNRSIANAVKLLGCYPLQVSFSISVQNTWLDMTQLFPVVLLQQTMHNREKT